ncbi:hypothetical protein Tco_0989191 [Tanacetum coccineum]|uniref:Reverse transcriptase domain-containing protein n=1 Tax=Tanacetum coccineum TaxID=301880 RepID=A0ABQ5ET73_9ASTR
MSSLKTLIKQHNEKSETLIKPIRLTFGDEEEGDKAKSGGKRTEEEKDGDLQKPYKEEVNHLSLDALTKQPKKILATKLQLQLPPCPTMIETLKKENLDRYCDYHEEKGHYTNDCYKLKRQLEAALKSGNLGHLVKDVRQ